MRCSVLKLYFEKILDMAKHGDAREESYYSHLEDLLKAVVESKGKRNIHITTLPKKTEAGNPDFRIWDGRQKIIGYIEAKNPLEEHLDSIEETDQLKRYLHTFPNLILTNFFEFRLYRDGKLIDKVLVGKPYVIHKLQKIPPVEHQEEFFNLMDKFFSFSIPNTYTARSLAIELAKRTRFLREEVIIEELKEEEEKDAGFILGFYKAFKDHLITGLSPTDFADLYSQTITFGLFAARSRAETDFNRKLAYDYIPHTIGLLRDIFQFVSLGDLPTAMEWIIDDISEVLAVSDVHKIMHDFYKEGKGKDPIVHFYETFLSEYDPQAREKRGVYYTPESVVSYIVNSLHLLLKERFDKEDGFATQEVTVLDPAAGTLTFPAWAAKLACEEYQNKWGEGGIKDLIKEHILKNFYALELMMAPYAIGHLKMSFLLEELGYKLQKDDRFKLYLTNTLEMEELAQIDLPGMAALSKESQLAGKVKKESPILVILGNPPYSVSSANKSNFIDGYFGQREATDKKGKRRILKEYERGILDDYKDDVRDETNIQPLSDDYIKFIRFAHYKIEQAKVGLIGMITNNSYLSGLIHRGMRHKLLNGFDEIYILNLHGNSRIGERCPDGSKDENVFDIQQGVSIVLFVKNSQESEEKPATVYYYDLWGLRGENNLEGTKYHYLWNNNIKTTTWQELKPVAPYYFFVPKDFSLQTEYDKFWKLTEIFKEWSSGVKTHRDHFVVGFSKEEIVQRLRVFAGNLSDELVRKGLYLKDTRDWKLKEAREKAKEGRMEDKIYPYNYRAFDKRWICYEMCLIDKGCDRWGLMKHMLTENIILGASRKYPETKNFGTLVGNSVGDIHFVADQTYFFPLYLYADTTIKEKRRGIGVTMMLFEPRAPYIIKTPNISENLLQSLTRDYNKTPTPESIFYYIYAILYSNTYRKKYEEFLKIDFPGIPFTKDLEVFNQLAESGKELIDLHLMKSKELLNPIAKFQGEKDNKVEKVKFEEGNSRVYINDMQFFEGIDKDIWNYHIGSYQVLDKWLKDRKGRKLSLEEIKHYCKIGTAIKETIELQERIEQIYPEVESNRSVVCGAGV